MCLDDGKRQIIMHYLWMGIGNLKGQYMMMKPCVWMLQILETLFDFSTTNEKMQTYLTCSSRLKHKTHITTMYMSTLIFSDFPTPPNDL